MPGAGLPAPFPVKTILENKKRTPMNLKIILSGLLVLVVAAVVLVACQVTPESGPDFDRRKML